jgi:rare lipoprotein A
MSRRLLLPVLVAVTLAGCGGAPSKPAPPPAVRVETPPPTAATVPAPRLPYTPAQEDLGKRGDYVAGGLYAPGVRDSAPAELPDLDRIPEPEVKAEPRSRYGNRTYSVLGKRYRVMDRPDGYVEQGIASYYGNKFHGRRTSSLEVYDMYAFSAAHKTLPLPSYARVTHLGNGKSVVVRINDRGPFHAGRVIDLSYAAAVKLGLHRTGTAKVEVRVLPAPGVARASATTAAAAEAVTLQVASYASRDTAERGLARLHAAGLADARLLEPATQKFWRLRIGPVDAAAVAALSTRLAGLGFGPPLRLRE